MARLMRPVNTKIKSNYIKTSYRRGTRGNKGKTGTLLSMIRLPISIQDPYIIVALDGACRQQQVNEGWFAAIARRCHHMRSACLLTNHVICQYCLHHYKACARLLRYNNALNSRYRIFSLQAYCRNTRGCAICLDKDSASLL